MREYLLIFAVAAAFTYGATPFVRALAIVVGAITPVRDRDVHDQLIPRLGGVGIFVGFLAAVLVAIQLPKSAQLFSSGELKGVVLGAAIICLVGAIDDIRELDALTKLSGQVLAAAVMAYQGVQLISLPVFGVTVLPTPVLIGVTVLIVLVTTNAVNFIDGLDGLAAGIVGIASLAFFGYSYLISQDYNPPNVFSVATFITAATLGCCVGFLPHNFHPARLFMGDCGALLLGLLLSSATITMTGSIDPSSVSRNQVTATLIPIIVPLAVLSLPLFDMAFAIVRRLRAGLPPWHPDAGHLHHRMLKLGHGHRGAVLLLYLWAALLALGSVSFAYVEGWAAGVVIAVLLAGTVFLTLRLPKWSPSSSL